MSFTEFINTPMGAMTGFIIGGFIAFVFVMIRLTKVKGKEKSQVIRWFNATHAILTCINDKNVYLYGGVVPGRSWKKLEREGLRAYWDITDVNYLNKTIRYLMHNDSEYNNSGEISETDGWDYSRAMSLLSSGYICAYLTKEEALDKSLEVAKVIQKRFNSWDEFIDSYLKGYEKWSKHTAMGRWQIYENLRKEKDSIFSAPWDLELKREW